MVPTPVRRARPARFAYERGSACRAISFDPADRASPGAAHPQPRRACRASCARRSIRSSTRQRSSTIGSAAERGCSTAPTCWPSIPPRPASSPSSLARPRDPQDAASSTASRDLAAAAEGIAYPVMVKANIGGSGAGIVRYDVATGAARLRSRERTLPQSRRRRAAGAGLCAGARRHDHAHRDARRQVPLRDRGRDGRRQLRPLPGRRLRRPARTSGHPDDGCDAGAGDGRARPSGSPRRRASMSAASK